jgi:3-hydroxybutyryl-CoA dehydratase
VATPTTIPAASITADEFAAGFGFENTGRTITEADVVGFAGLTGDWNPQHVNLEWTRRNTRFGERIAHGLLISSVAVGMIPARLKRALGPISSAHAVYKRPVVLGDTIRIAGRTLGDPESLNGGGPDDPPGIDLRVLNHRDELVSRMKLRFGRRASRWSLAPWEMELGDAVELPMHELLAGRPYRTPGRTLTEAHVVGFSSVTGDWSRPHADAEWARESPAGARTAHEMLLIAVAAPMVPLDVSRLIAARRAQIAWHEPARVGDTMHIEGHFLRSTPAGDGAVQEVYEFGTVNQRGEPLASLTLALVMHAPDDGR